MNTEPDRGDNRSTEEEQQSDHDEMVELMALVDEINRRLNALGAQQRMSVGPTLSDVEAMREQIVERGKNYGLIDQSETEATLRADAADLVVDVEEGE